MLGLIQRVTDAEVVVDGVQVGAIKKGLLLLLGVQKNDTEQTAQKLIKKVLDYRVFSDDVGKMNLSLRDINGEILVVSQFTLAADTQKGLRPSFSSAAAPADAKKFYEYFLTELAHSYPHKIASGIFGADMKVRLTNDGPVTFMLEAQP